MAAKCGSRWGHYLERGMRSTYSYQTCILPDDDSHALTCLIQHPGKLGNKAIGDIGSFLEEGCFGVLPFIIAHFVARKRRETHESGSRPTVKGGQSNLPSVVFFAILWHVGRNVYKVGKNAGKEKRFDAQDTSS